MFLHFVDYCFCIFQKSEVERFFSHVKSVEPAIQLTEERERDEDDTLPFFDVLVTREHEELKVSAYRKPTHIRWYL